MMSGLRSRSVWVRPLRVVALLCVVVGSVAFGVAPASASSTTVAASGNGAGWAGKDPSVQGCAADGYTVQLVGVDPLGSMAGLELRYSPACNANWARLTARSYTPAWVSLCVVNDANRGDIQCTGSVRNGYLWSPMMDGHKKVFASVGFSLDSGGGGHARTGAF